MTRQEFFATLRSGPYTWPGGYPIALLMRDGETLCHGCAFENAAIIGRAPRSRDRQWTAEAWFVNWEDSSLYCAHCNAPIECAYPEES